MISYLTSNNILSLRKILYVETEAHLIIQASWKGGKTDMAINMLLINKEGHSSCKQGPAIA